jgi:hypothetical protein
MIFPNSTRSKTNSRSVCRRHTRPELLPLEDRLSPGQAGFGGTLALSLLGPALASLQLDALTSGAAAVPAAPPAAGPVSHGVAFEPPIQPAPVSLLQPIAAAQGQAAETSHTPAVADPAPQAETTSGSHALDLGAQAAQQAANSQRAGAADGTAVHRENADAFWSTAPDRAGSGTVSGNPTPFVPPDGGAGTKNTVVGAAVQANSSTICGNGHGKIQSETAIAHSGNAVVIGYNDSRGLNCPGSGYQITGWAYSLDRGRSFTDGGTLPGGTSHSGDPWLATGPDGTIYYADLYGGGIGVLRGTVTGSGVSWAGPTTFGGGTGTDKESMTVDPTTGTIYVTYTRFSGGQGIWLYKSTNGGLSFTGPTPVSTAASLQGSVSSIGPNGELYVTWSIGYPNETGIGFARSFDGGQTFQVFTQIAPVLHQAVSGMERDPHNPHIAVDRSGGPHNGNIYITYHSAHLGGGTNLDSVIVRSTDGGMTWSAATRINDDGTAAQQWYPTVNVDTAGFVHSFWYDRRVNSGNLTDIYYARSTDGGVSWEPNVRVTPQSFNMTTIGSSEGFSNTWGDYMNAEAQGKGALVAFAGGQNGDPDSYFTRVGNRD